MHMSGDDDPGQEPHPELRYTAGIATKGQPVTGQTFAQKQGPFIGPLILGLSFILGQLLLYFGLLFAGRGERLPFPLSIWGAKEKPPVTVTFGFGVIASCVSAVAVIYLAKSLGDRGFMSN